MKQGGSGSGPSGAGSSSNFAETTPTVGFQMEQFTRNNIKFTVFDMSGQSRYRNLWEVYYADVQVSMYVGLMHLQDICPYTDL